MVITIQQIPRKSAHIILVTGGQRSGKSAFAEEIALGRSPRPAYIATARILDEDMQQRVAIHRQRREDRWHSSEAPYQLADADFGESGTALVDCLTLWAANWFFEKNECVSETLAELKGQIDRICEKKATIIFVTNEIGSGGISPNATQRHFADLQGALNQYVAKLADEVYWVVSGIPVKIKPNV